MEALETNLALLAAPDGGAAYNPPADQAVAALLEQRAKVECAWSWLGSSQLVCVNPLRVLGSLDDASAAIYANEAIGTSPERAQPHPYALAGRVYNTMREMQQSQAIVYDGLSGSGKTFTAKLVTEQLFRLELTALQERNILHDRLKAVDTVLEAFGSYSSSSGSAASAHARHVELHYAQGRLAGAQVLGFALDKHRTTRILSGERSFNVFYQLLAGATAQERQECALRDQAGDYVVLSRSGTSRLAGDLSGAKDRIAFDALRPALTLLGFRSRQIIAIWRVLSAILLLGNVNFEPAPPTISNAQVVVDAASRPALEIVAALLGVETETLEQSLVTECRAVRKELCTVVVDEHGAARQRDALAASIYGLLFSSIVESVNVCLAPPAGPTSSIVQLDVPGFVARAAQNRSDKTRSTLLSSRNTDDHQSFLRNLGAELVGSFTHAQAWQDPRLRADDVDQRRSAPVDPYEGRIELLRGGALGSRADSRPGGLLALLSQFTSSLRKGKPGAGSSEIVEAVKGSFQLQSSFIPLDADSFGVAHFGGAVKYDARDFVEADADLVDVSIVSMMRQSENSFLAGLFLGPALLTEAHPRDKQAMLAAKVSSIGQRSPSALEGSVPNLVDVANMASSAAQLNSMLSAILQQMRGRQVWTVTCLRPNLGDSGLLHSGHVAHQSRLFGLASLCTSRRHDYVCSYESSALEKQAGMASASAVAALQLREGEDFAIGKRRIWLSYAAGRKMARALAAGDFSGRDPSAGPTAEERELEQARMTAQLLRDQYKVPIGLISPLSRAETHDEQAEVLRADSPEPTSPDSLPPRHTMSSRMGLLEDPTAVASEKWQSPPPSASFRSQTFGSKTELDSPYNYHALPELTKGAPAVEVAPVSTTRRLWLVLVWTLTFWIPTFTLRIFGRMKRPDQRLAWREKVTLCILIAFSCGIVIFYIVFFGKILCPQFNYAWNLKELGFHQGQTDYWVGVRGVAYDLTNFYRGQHSDITGLPVTAEDMLMLGGQDVSGYFPPPINLACAGLTNNANLVMSYANFTMEVPTALHVSGSQQAVRGSALADQNWYPNTFLPAMQPFKKGPIVYTPGDVKDGADRSNKIWAIYKDKVYDLSDYFYSLQLNGNAQQYAYLDSSISSLFQQQPGQDLTNAINGLRLDATKMSANLACMDNLFFVGNTDFRITPRCSVQNNLLLAFSIVLVATIFIKFLAALQITTKRVPEPRDKFVIMQVPCYSEGEEGLKKTIDSLTVLEYDDRRKLLFIICDGMVVGRGNDRPTPRIVLDTLGVDPALDPEPLLFKSLGEGSKQLNYGKVWSGLYEHQGHVVPFVVVCKVGKPTERSRPGNRGKRDSQILLMRFLNRVHFDAPMAPLELEIQHQISNVIGVDPKLYEFCLCVDADTEVKPDSLNRLIAVAGDDSKIIGLCGETKLSNESKTWWTAIQVYEYFISHHLAKAFESLFGSVTCLPGCFTLLRLRSADKGRPLWISNLVIDDYAENQVDTLHKKNLLTLGEDRYLTTLLLKHFPSYKTKFTPDAVAFTLAPDSFSVLLSQRRRWINSTVHNLMELMNLKDLCGVCCFSMRFVVFIDLLGTIILPATTVYLVYLIVTVALHQATLPIISLLMIGAVYGLQIVLFLIKRQWSNVFWLLIYLLAYPLYGFLLPIYSFWRFDDFSWGQTRSIMEGKNKRIIHPPDDEPYDDSLIPLASFSDYQSKAWGATPAEGEKEVLYGDSGQSSPMLPPSFPAHAARASRETLGYGPSPPVYAAPPSHQRHQPAGTQMSGFGMMPSAHRSYHSLDMRSVMSMPFMPYGSPFMPPAGAASPYAHSRASSAAHSPSASAIGLGPPLISSPLAPSENPAPSDAELEQAVRVYLSSQDLMHVTRRSARDAIAAAFPRANLDARRAFLNDKIDAFCRGSG